MRFEIFVPFMALATALTGTNVNVSFIQQNLRASANTSELPNDEISLKTTDFLERYKDDKKSNFVKIQVDGKNFKDEVENISKVALNMKSMPDLSADYRFQRLETKNREPFFDSHYPVKERSFYNPNHEVHIVQGQLKNLSPQDKQNMDFERYIQNYHSEPTVETIYESANPEMQYNVSPTSLKGSSQQIVEFERQISLPAKPDSRHQASNIVKPIVNLRTDASSNAMSLGSSTSLSTSSLSSEIPSVSTTAGNNFKVNLKEMPSSVGKDGLNFYLNYNKPNYNDPTVNYKNGYFYNELPHSLEEPHNSYNQYYNNMYRRQQITEDNPNDQRQVVTKTIRIAQPAIKAKKYEVRHPAIQKQFYDIEERVVIKPAGTVVVELERPSAKILKEETTLPLGHPHPAVAAAYMQNRNTQTISNVIYRNAGSFSSRHYNTNNTNSEPNLSTYNNNVKIKINENSQNKDVVGESFYSDSTDDSPQQQSEELAFMTNGHGNQRQLSTHRQTFTREETKQSPSRTELNHRDFSPLEDNAHSTSLANITPQRTGLPVTHNSRDDISLDAEYITNSGNSTLRKDSKPARLQNKPSERVIEHKKLQQPIIKHKHKILLQSGQHIYLGQNQVEPQTKFLAETAIADEIKPHIQSHSRPVVVYAPEASELKYVQMPKYLTRPILFSQGGQQHNYPQSNNAADNLIQYNAPYAQMRSNLDEDSTQNDKVHRKYSYGQYKSENLILDDKVMEDVKNSIKERAMEKQLPQAHIEIKVSNSSFVDNNKTIVFSSTIRPAMIDDDHDEVHHSKLEISVTNNGEPKKEKTLEKKLDNYYESKNLSANETYNMSNLKTKLDCNQMSKLLLSDNHEIAPERQHTFSQIVEASSPANFSNDVGTRAESSTVLFDLHAHNVNINAKSSADDISPVGSHVIASSTVPKESTPSESFQKRRIVVNHPFQTVREVVEHEPYTNYHEVQVHEPAAPALYHSANYYKSHGSLHLSDIPNSSAYYP